MALPIFTLNNAFTTVGFGLDRIVWAIIKRKLISQTLTNSLILCYYGSYVAVKNEMD